MAALTAPRSRRSSRGDAGERGECFVFVEHRRPFVAVGLSPLVLFGVSLHLK
jgi:hypothetical protein